MLSPGLSRVLAHFFTWRQLAANHHEISCTCIVSCVCNDVNAGYGRCDQVRLNVAERRKNCRELTGERPADVARMRPPVTVAESAIVAIKSIAVVAGCGPRNISVCTAAVGIDATSSSIPVVPLFLVSVEFIDDRVVCGKGWVQRKRHDRLGDGRAEPIFRSLRLF